MSREQPGSWEWTLCAASVTGTAHERRGQGCDDAYCYALTDDYVVAAVADGAGSYSGTSAWGAYTATQSVLKNALRRQFIRDFRSDPRAHAAQLQWLFERALAAVLAQAAAMGVDAALLSTTLNVAIANPRHAAFGQIGDGVIAIETASGIDTLLTESKEGYANTTWFLQSADAFEESFRTASRTGVTALALSTDGMSYKITNIATGRPYEPFFRGSWQHVRSGASSGHFAALLRGIQDDQTGDDKTMVLAALRWEDDEFHPSARPRRTLTLSSRAPVKPVPRGDAVPRIRMGQRR